jgi:RNA polymerase sigma factor (sigma-70 family)
VLLYRRTYVAPLAKKIPVHFRAVARTSPVTATHGGRMPVSLLKLCPSAEALAPDADLLARFVHDRDGPAFAELVRRHGPLVYRVCRRVSPSCADDAFQNTFVALARSAHTVRGPVLGWLVGVAGRCARKLRAAETARDARERAFVPRPPVPNDSAELAVALDDELSQLPLKLRSAVVLCLVEGRTQPDAAAELGWSARTLRRRLDRAKAVLRARLERRGFAPAVALGALSAPATAVPPNLFRAAVAAASAPPAKGLVLMAKLKVLAVVAVGALACAGFARPDDEQPPPAVPLQPYRVPVGDGLRIDVPPLGPKARAEGHTYKTANFVVTAPTETMARVMAHDAEHHRKELAEKWLRAELPAWSKPCTLHYTSAIGATNGATTFTFGRKAGAPTLETAEMELRGEFLKVLETALPHEVTHTVLASHLKRPIPRWADEGIALQAESPQSHADHDAKARELLNAGRGIRLRVLFRMTDYPQDLLVTYAQGHSLVRFLLTREIDSKSNTPESRLLKFVDAGSAENTAESWDKAARDHFGFKTMDALEEAWLDALRAAAPPKPAKGEGDTIPPAKLPVPNP